MYGNNTLHFYITFPSLVLKKALISLSDDLSRGQMGRFVGHIAILGNDQLFCGTRAQKLIGFVLSFHMSG
jgi:hypothetical protein